MSTVGALLLLVVHGPGKLSLDEQQGRLVLVGEAQALVADGVVEGRQVLGVDLLLHLGLDLQQRVHALGRGHADVEVGDLAAHPEFEKMIKHLP